MTPYDDVPYESYPYADSHPDRLRLVAHLFHLAPAPAERCRVLEVGCGAGGNLIPMAATLPESRFLGVDLAARAIAEGQETIAALGLENIELRHGDLAALEPDGTFDYILAHGVYSWVPPPVRGALLDLFARALAPEGVAYVSHNVKPGWFARQAAREMMRIHIAGIADPAAQIEQARALLGFVAGAAIAPDWAPVVRAQFETVVRAPDCLIFHDNLAPVNDGCWFEEMVAELTARGLQYLGDAELGSMLPAHLGEGTLATLDRITGDVVRHQQYLDFITNRAFRMTLAVRADRVVDRSLDAAQAEPLHFSAQLAEGADGKFRTPNGGEVTVGRAPTVAALRALIARAPASLPFAELARAADGADVGGDLMQLLMQGFVDAALTPARCAAAPGERPRAPAYARHAAARGSSHVASLRHTNVRLTDELAAALPLVDGTRARAELPAAALARLAEVGLLLP